MNVGIRLNPSLPSRCRQSDHAPMDKRHPDRVHQNRLNQALKHYKFDAKFKPSGTPNGSFAFAEKAEIAKPLSMHISRHSFAHIAQEAEAESSAIKNILGHSNLATTERYMGRFDTSKTDETLRNVFAKKQP